MIACYMGNTYLLEAPHQQCVFIYSFLVAYLCFANLVRPILGDILHLLGYTHVCLLLYLTSQCCKTNQQHRKNQKL